MIKFFRAPALVLCLFTLIFSVDAQAQFWKKQSQSLLPDHQAFIETAHIDDTKLVVQWQIADDYYMYRDQFDVVAITPDVEFGQASYPKGIVEEDPEFGEVVVYFNHIEYSLPILSVPKGTKTLELELRGQGCNKPVGVCYAPQIRPISIDYQAPVDLASSSSTSTSTTLTTDQLGSSKQTQSSATSSVQTFKDKEISKSFWGYLVTAFGAGLLLSFTPCVLPMIPILAGIIGRQQSPSKLKSGWLAICYVGGTMLTYAVAGWVAGASGTQLQAHFQSPLAIGIVCSFLILLAMSLFGAFKIQLPSSLQTKLNSTSVSSRSASISSFALGLISALVVGACVSPILIVTLGAAISQGDPVLGAGIMSAMALGMGVLLILFGFGAGWLLPRTGAWMNQIQVLFGFMVLGVAIYLTSFIEAAPTLYLWAALLLWTGSYLMRFAQQVSAELINALLRGLGIATLLWGAMALIGATTGGKEILSPLNTLSLSNNVAAPSKKLPFSVVTNADQAKQHLEKAKQQGQPVLVDFYADWCLDCKRMDRTTFLSSEVHAAMKGWSLIKIDVTDTNKNSEFVKKYFDVFGPPATLFFDQNGNEKQTLRQYGYLEVDEFISLATKTTVKSSL